MSMQKICLVFLVNEGFDSLTAFERAFREIGFDVDVIRIPNFWLDSLSKNQLRSLRALFKEKKAKGRFLFFSPQSTELFMKEADLTVSFSAYRSWFNHDEMRVIPHLGTPVRPPESIDSLRWASKPPLRVGFMGRIYDYSRLANFILQSPAPLKKRLLQGAHLRYPGLIALMNDLGFPMISINTFSRIETMKRLKANIDKYAGIELDIVQTPRFDGSEQDLNKYTNHLERNTYIVCPRGTENYSFRIYEALGRGRIPVIIDTDVVLPKEINWDRLSIRVPYESLDKINDIIVQDYESKSSEEFVARQTEAFLSMAELRTMRWVKDLAGEVGARIKINLA